MCFCIGPNEEGNGGATPRRTQNGRRWTVVANQVWLKNGSPVRKGRGRVTGKETWLAGRLVEDYQGMTWHDSSNCEALSLKPSIWCFY